MLMFLLHHWIVISIFIVLVFASLAGTAILEAWLDVRKRPTEPMFWCHEHGPFRKQHALPLFPEMGGLAENSFICPSCYKKAVFDDPNKKMKVS